VFGKSLSILFANFIPFLIIGVVVQSPLIAFSLYHAEKLQTSPGRDPDFSATPISLASA
jgi:hypothetical protein